jgi:hypothetical protein
MLAILVLAEFKCKLGLRTLLTITFLTIAFLWLFICLQSETAEAVLHHMALNRMRILLEDGKSDQVRAALDAYEAGYVETHSAKAAATRMLNALEEQ